MKTLQDILDALCAVNLQKGQGNHFFALLEAAENYLESGDRLPLIDAVKAARKDELEEVK